MATFWGRRKKASWVTSSRGICSILSNIHKVVQEVFRKCEDESTVTGSGICKFPIRGKI